MSEDGSDNGLKIWPVPNKAWVQRTKNAPSMFWQIFLCLCPRTEVVNIPVRIRQGAIDSIFNIA